MSSYDPTAFQSVVPPVAGSITHLHQQADASNQGIIVQVGRDLLIYQGHSYLRLHQIADDELRMSRQFVAPAHYNQALEVIGSHHAVVLLGNKESGRRTAALQLLQERSPGSLFELIPDFERPSVERLPLQSGKAFVIDLSDEDQSPTELFGRQLMEYSNRLRDHASYLAILTTREVWQPCREATARLCVELGMPPARELVSTLLTERFGAWNRVAWLEQAPLVALIQDGHRAGELARLAERLSEIEDSDADRQQLAEEYQRWNDYLTDWFGNKDDVRTRALFIAAALLDGAPAATIMNSADGLAKAVAVEPPPGGPLAGPDFSKRIEDINAERIGDSVVVSRERPLLDQAVLDHVWLERPQLRKTLLAWMAGISAPNSPAATHADQIARTLARISVRHGTTDVLDVVEEWAGSDGGRRRLAAKVLEEIAVSPQVGARVRSKMRDWLAAQRPGEGRMWVVAQVCGGSLGEQRPQVALRRLKGILAQDDSEAARQAAGVALRRLAARHDLRPVVLNQIMEWMQSEADRRAGYSAFLALVDLTSEDSIVQALLASDAESNASSRRFLRECWRLILPALDELPDGERIFNNWLDAGDVSAIPLQQTQEILAPALNQAGLRTALSRTLLRWDSAEDQRPLRTALIDAWIGRHERPALADGPNPATDPQVL